ncbi:MAG TPA: MmgE/PrpD family protein [Burkholderiales bacterium]|nr:MmgE/PrpD family protein [Burkholderiales bacterium]
MQKKKSSPKPTLAQQLAEHHARLSYRQIPESSRHAMKRLLLDYLGVAIAGSQTESGRIAREFARRQGKAPQATLIGGGERVPIAAASFANAISCHSIELDDIDVLALFHFSPPVFSAALAVGEANGASGKDLVAALASGCEVMERASTAANNDLRNRAFHTTPTCGVFGATVAAGKLMKLTAARLTSALGLAGAQASGLMEMYGPSMQKRFNPGPAARNGVTAAAMAHLGFTGADTIFEGERGFLRAFAGRSDGKALVRDLDAPYELKIEFKPYSCARPIHNAIDCALDIRSRHAPAPGDIRSIVVRRHPDWAEYHQNTSPRTYHEAQVSLPYSLAIALIEGGALLAQYTDRKLRHPDVRRLMALTRIESDASLPRGVSCHTTVTMKTGDTYVSQVDYSKGSIENPMSDDELRGKFDSLAAPVVGRARAAQIAETAMRIERCADVGALLRLTAASAARSRAKR